MTQSSPSAAEIIHRHTLLAAAGGLLPIPLLDFAVVSGVCLRMLRELAEVFDVDFRTELARAAISALVSGGAAGLVGGPAMVAGLGLFPPLRLVLGPAAASAVTYALGRVFALHFSLGGSFRDFDPEAYRSWFASQKRRGENAGEVER